MVEQGVMRQDWIPIDLSDKEMAKVVRRARFEAGKIGITGSGGPSSSLVKMIDALDLGKVNRLAGVVMVKHPDARAGATGAGAVWAVATRLVNEAASEVLKTRPPFEELGGS